MNLFSDPPSTTQNFRELKGTSKNARGRPEGDLYGCPKYGNVFEYDGSFLRNKRGHFLLSGSPQEKTEEWILNDIKVEDDSEAMTEPCEFEYIEIESIDIKEEIEEGKILSL